MSMTDPTGHGRDQTDKFVLLAIFVFTTLLTLKYFPGLENEPSYAGLSFQAIYPDALAGDPYYGPHLSMFENFFGLSSIYVLPKLFGEIWLDDRFIVVVYALLVFVSLVAIDRIGLSLGLEGPIERSILLLLFIKDHQILLNKVLIAHHPDINHAAFSIPIILWLIYIVINRKSVFLILIISALLITVSVRNAPYAIGASLLYAALVGRKSDRVIVGIVFFSAIAAAIYAVQNLIPIGLDERVAVWNILVEKEGAKGISFYLGDDGIPVHETILRNVAFLAVCCGALIGPWSWGSPFQAIRFLVLVGLALWLAGGLWGNFAPDFLKYPQFLGFSVVRLMQWPQNLAYIAIITTTLHWHRTKGDRKGFFVTGGILAVLFLLGPGNYDLWLGLLVVSGLGVALAHFVYQGMSGTEGVLKGGARFFGFSTPSPEKSLAIIAQVMAVTLLIAFGNTIAKKYPAWKFLADTGVFGDSTPARWTGIAEFVRRTTPETAVVLSYYYQYENPKGASVMHEAFTENESRGKLATGRSLASRSGRGTPTLHRYSSPFSLQGWKEEKEQFAFLERAGRSLIEGRSADAWEAIQVMAVVPDYLLIPVDVARRLDISSFPFVEEASIDGYALMRRLDYGSVSTNGY